MKYPGKSAQKAPARNTATKYVRRSIAGFEIQLEADDEKGRLIGGQ
jgi:hypothetical protein